MPSVDGVISYPELTNLPRISRLRGKIVFVQFKLKKKKKAVGLGVRVPGLIGGSSDSNVAVAVVQLLSPV